jgi:hypothetical protein
MFQFITTEATIVVIVVLLLRDILSTMTKSSPLHFQRWLRKIHPSCHFCTGNWVYLLWCAGEEKLAELQDLPAQLMMIVPFEGDHPDAFLNPSIARKCTFFQLQHPHVTITN